MTSTVISDSHDETVSRIRSKFSNWNVFENDELRRDCPKDKCWDKLPSSWNIILFGPTGAGKSSLIYTWWRALNGGESANGRKLSEFAEQSMLRQLKLGWSLRDTGEQPVRNPADDIKTQHGTTTFESFVLRPPTRTAAGITVHDTMGQQFYDEREEEHAELLLQGKLVEGSTFEKRQQRYWLMLGKIGFWDTSSLATRPHAVVLLFDASLRSFINMLQVDEEEDEEDVSDTLLMYQNVVRRAGEMGHAVFVALTHADGVGPVEGSTGGGGGGGGSAKGPGGSEEAQQQQQDQQQQHDNSNKQQHLSIERLAVALGLPVERIFWVENYRRERTQQGSSVDAAVLRLLEQVVEEADAFAGRNCPVKDRCSIS